MAMIALLMEAVSTYAKSVTSTRLHGAKFQRTVIFIFAAART
jgi:hypothetical protein